MIHDNPLVRTADRLLVKARNAKCRLLHRNLPAGTFHCGDAVPRFYRTRVNSDRKDG